MPRSSPRPYEFDVSTSNATLSGAFTCRRGCLQFSLEVLVAVILNQTMRGTPRAIYIIHAGLSWMHFHRPRKIKRKIRGSSWLRPGHRDLLVLITNGLLSTWLRRRKLRV